MSNDVLYRLWGKTNERERKKEENAPYRWHSAMCHMIDVGHVAETWLINDSFLRRRLLRLSGLEGTVPEQDLVNILVSVTALHDLGKVSPLFQAKSDTGWKTGYGSLGTLQRPPKNGAGFDHGCGTSVALAQSITKRKNERRRDDVKDWKPVINAAAGHHGRIYDSSEWKIDDVQYDFAYYALPGQIAHQAFDDLCRLFDAPEVWPSITPSAPFLILFAGFVSICDWLGSNSEVYRFTDGASTDYHTLEEYRDQLRKEGRGEEQLREIGLLNSPVPREHDYRSLFGFDEPRGLQLLAAEAGFGEFEGPELLVVEAQMGLGKTEIALYATAQAFTHGTATGLYFGLPTQASSNAMFARILEFTRKVGAGETPLSIGLMHGNRRFVEHFREVVDKTWRMRLELERAGDRAINDRVAPPSEAIAPGWLQSSKRSLLSTIGVGTIDQALLGQIQSRHAFVRLYALAGKVVVFDEIHAYDAYTGNLIQGLLGWLSALGAKVILLSATLPRSLREDLATAFGASLPESEREPMQDPYPLLVHWREGAETNVCSLDERTLNDQTTTSVVVTEHAGPIEERTAKGVALLLDAARQGGCIGWIRNTVREAQEAYDMALEACRTDSELRECDVRLLHSRYTRTDRAAIESDLVDLLGKSPSDGRPKRIIVIATQVIEQSVDLDFDEMISDLAPIDLLLQRLGRMWRHSSNNVDRHERVDPVLHVLAPTEEEYRRLRFGPSGYVYEPDILARSLYLLREHSRWPLPESCRTLVSLLYDQDETIWNADFLGVEEASLAEAVRRRQLEADAQEGKSRLISMPSPVTSGSAFSMREAVHDDDGSRLQLATRHILNSGTIVLLELVDDEIRFLGSDTPAWPPPADDDFRARLAFEEDLTKASIGFPWWSSLDPDPEADTRVQQLTAWWQEKRPYDSPLFLLLDDQGTFGHPQIRGAYRRNEELRFGGLVVERVKDVPGREVSGEEL